MKIALIGYGKMGQAIERTALAIGHEVVARITSANTLEMSRLNVLGAEVAIEFSRPETAFDNIKTCIEQGIPVICGTTGWLDKAGDIKELTAKFDGAFLYASNFSLGVNIFFALNRHLARLLAPFDEYQPNVHEVHHIHKLDSPSGTAKTIAEDLQQCLQRISDINITADRVGEVPGTHIVTYSSAVDTIEIKHEAHNREGFAKGAVVAADWIRGKKGFFTMNDVLSIRK